MVEAERILAWSPPSYWGVTDLSRATPHYVTNQMLRILSRDCLPWQSGMDRLKTFSYELGDN